MADAEWLELEVVYATPRRQWLRRLRVRGGSTVGDAIQRSGVLKAFPDIDPTDLACGVFGRRVGASEKVRAGDRVEIYRRLIVEPKHARRMRAHAIPQKNRRATRPD